MKKSSRIILQIGLAAVFIVIGIMILMDPSGWAALIQPWAAKLIPGSITTAMIQTAYLDLVIGILFLIRPTIWIAAFLGAIHLVTVLVTTGITVITIRDIGLLATTVAVFIETIPAPVVSKLLFWRK